MVSEVEVKVHGWIVIIIEFYYGEIISELHILSLDKLELLSGVNGVKAREKLWGATSFCNTLYSIVA